MEVEKFLIFSISLNRTDKPKTSKTLFQVV